MQTILSVGEDPSLLYIRGLVLATSGADVSSAAPAQGLQLLAASSFDLLVFCHSVRESDLLRLCAVSRATTNPPRTLLLEIPGAAFRLRAEMDSRHSLEDGPGVLMKQVCALLGSADPDPAGNGSRLIPFAQAWRYEVNKSALQEVLHSSDEGLPPGTSGRAGPHQPRSCQ